MTRTIDYASHREVLQGLGIALGAAGIGIGAAPAAGPAVPVRDAARDYIEAARLARWPARAPDPGPGRGREPLPPYDRARAAEGDAGQGLIASLLRFHGRRRPPRGSAGLGLEWPAIAATVDGHTFVVAADQGELILYHVAPGASATP